MRLLAVIAAIPALAFAQSLTSSIPQCAVECMTKAVQDGTTCDITNNACLCTVENYRAIYDVGAACVLQACGADTAAVEVLPAAQRFCEVVTGGATAAPVSSSAAPTGGSTSASESASTSESTSSSASATSAASSATSSAAAEGSAAQVKAGSFVLGVVGMLAIV